MNIEYFIKKRKALGLSQGELAKGICTQATLSHFENKGQIPNMKILLQLCDRLGISLSELFPKVEEKDSLVTKAMDQIEFLILTSEYQEATDQLAQLDLQQVQQTDALARYYYLEGFILFFNHAPMTETMFAFDQVLLEETSDSILRLLAFTGIGMIYMRAEDTDKADFYFNKILTQIYQYPVRQVEDTWRVLHIVFECGMYFAWKNELEISNSLLNYVVNTCSDNHVTYYLARAALQLAKNAITSQADTAQILELIYDARAYAKINRNKVALKELAQMEKDVRQDL